MNIVARVMLVVHAFAVAGFAAPTTQPVPDDVTLARLIDRSAPSAEAVELLLTDLKGPPVIREAAIRRLSRHPAAAAKPLIEAFATESLAVRSSILELLHDWAAPVDGIDTWDESSLTPQRLQSLRDWAATVQDAAPTTAPATLSDAALRLARRDMERMLAAPSPDTARVIRERLARFGESLLPEVYARLGAAAGDEPLRRLKTLRYRLVATDRLALTWAQGLERLASGEPRERITALDELTSKATSDDQRLLLELFSDPEPFVRERALRALRTVGGDAMNAAMAGLLRDPEPNVRAAVLKELAANPSPQIVTELVGYVKTERDADLVVHAVRVLREIKTDDAIDCLSDLLGHESWRVRAEAVDAITEAARNYDAVKKASLYTRLIKLLDDEDGFVVARAVAALHDAKLAAALDPMARAAERHPEIAAEVVETMTREEPLATQSLRHLRVMHTHADPVVRAAAIGGICAVAPKTCGKELDAALRDPEPRVRSAAAMGMVTALTKLRGGGSGEASINFARTVLGTGASESADWLENFRAGKGRPAYVDAAVPLLEPMLDAPSRDDRTAAALALVAAGREERALPVLEGAAAEEPRYRAHVVTALAWLPWEQRVALFDRLLALRLDAQQFASAAAAMGHSPDARARPVLWALLGADATVEQLSAVVDALRASYFNGRYYDAENLPARQKKAAIDDALARATSGPELQRTAALVLLADVSADDAARAAEQVLDDSSATEWLRIDALQVLLLTLEEKKAHAVAVQHVADAALRKVAVPFLALGGNELTTIRGSIYVSSDHMMNVFISQGTGQQIKVTPPKGLPIEVLEKTLADPDPKLAAMAGYLLAISGGDRAGYKKLEAYWRGSAFDDDDWRKMMYRAITALNEDALTPVLDEIYRGMDRQDFEMREFYWTIRGMSGANILALRKRIRDEVGMASLR